MFKQIILKNIKYFIFTMIFLPLFFVCHKIDSQAVTAWQTVSGYKFYRVTTETELKEACGYNENKVIDVMNNITIHQEIVVKGSNVLLRADFEHPNDLRWIDGNFNSTEKGAHMFDFTSQTKVTIQKLGFNGNWITGQGTNKDNTFDALVRIKGAGINIYQCYFQNSPGKGIMLHNCADSGSVYDTNIPGGGIMQTTVQDNGGTGIVAQNISDHIGIYNCTITGNGSNSGSKMYDDELDTNDYHNYPGIRFEGNSNTSYVRISNSTVKDNAGCGIEAEKSSGSSTSDYRGVKIDGSVNIQGAEGWAAVSANTNAGVFIESGTSGTVYKIDLNGSGTDNNNVLEIKSASVTPRLYVKNIRDSRVVVRASGTSERNAVIRENTNCHVVANGNNYEICTGHIHVVRAQYQDSNGNWGGYSEKKRETYYYGDTVSWSDGGDACYDYKSVSYTAGHSDKTSDVNVTRKKYTQVVNARYQDSSGGWGSYSNKKNESRYYGSSISWYDGGDACYDYCGTSYTVTEDKTTNIDVTRKKYLQTVRAQYQDSNGNYGGYGNEINAYYYYGATVSWSRAADARYKAASITSYSVTGPKSQDVSVARQKYRQIVNVRYQQANGGWSAYGTELDDYRYYESTVSWSKAGNPSACYYDANITSYVVYGDKTSNVDVGRKKYKQTIKARYQKSDGTYGDYSTKINAVEYYYGATCSWYETESARYNRCGTSYTVTGEKTSKIDVTRKKYKQTVKVQYETASGGYTASDNSGTANGWTTVINNVDYYYESTCAWSRAADSIYKKAETSYTVYEDKTVTIQIKRNTYTITLNKGYGIDSVTGAGTYRARRENEGDIAISCGLKSNYQWYTWTGSTGNLRNSATTQSNKVKTLTSNITLTAVAKGRQTVYIRYEKPDGTWTDYEKWIDAYYAQNETVAKTRAADSVYKVATISYTADKPYCDGASNSKYVSVYRNWYTVTLNKGIGISNLTLTGAGQDGIKFRARTENESNITIDAALTDLYTWNNWTGNTGNLKSSALTKSNQIKTLTSNISLTANAYRVLSGNMSVTADVIYHSGDIYYIKPGTGNKVHFSYTGTIDGLLQGMLAVNNMGIYTKVDKGSMAYAVSGHANTAGSSNATLTRSPDYFTSAGTGTFTRTGGSDGATKLDSYVYMLPSYHGQKIYVYPKTMVNSESSGDTWSYLTNDQTKGVYVMADDIAPIVNPTSISALSQFVEGDPVNYIEYNWISAENSGIDLQIEDPESGIKKIVLKVDGTEAVTKTFSTRTITYNLTHTITKEGSSNCVLIITDNLGNERTIDIKVKIDRTAPVISGLEKIKKAQEQMDEQLSLDNSDMTFSAFDWSQFNITVSTDDQKKVGGEPIATSGIYEFTVVITNKENGLKEVWSTDTEKATNAAHLLTPFTDGVDQGREVHKQECSISIDVLIQNADPELLNGMWEIGAYAVDYAGNESRDGADVEELSLSIELKPYFGATSLMGEEGGIPKYRLGETLELNIKTAGYIDAVFIEFTPGDVLFNTDDFEYGTIVFRDYEKGMVYDEDLMRINGLTENSRIFCKRTETDTAGRYDANVYIQLPLYFKSESINMNMCNIKVTAIKVDGEFNEDMDWEQIAIITQNGYENESSTVEYLSKSETFYLTSEDNLVNDFITTL